MLTVSGGVRKYNKLLCHMVTTMFIRNKGTDIKIRLLMEPTHIQIMTRSVLQKKYMDVRSTLV